MPNSQSDAFIGHWFHLLDLADQARRLAVEAAVANPLTVSPRDALAAILFSAIAAEAFINELAEAAERDAGSHAPDAPITSMLANLATTLKRAEESHKSPVVKYELASEILSGSKLPRGQMPFQDFINLMALRDELAHPRHRDETTVSRHIRPDSRVILDLQQRGRTQTRGRKPGEVPGGMSWLQEIESGLTADWAYSASREMIKRILEMLPDDHDYCFYIYAFRYTLKAM